MKPRSLSPKRAGVGVERPTAPHQGNCPGKTRHHGGQTHATADQGAPPMWTKFRRSADSTTGSDQNENSVSTIDEAVQNGRALKDRLAEQKKNPPSEIEQLRFQASNALCQLNELAKHDDTALELLANELLNAIVSLNTNIVSAPEHYRKLTRRCALRPAIVSVDKENQADQIWLATHMELGKDAPLNYTGRHTAKRMAEATKGCALH